MKHVKKLSILFQIIIVVVVLISMALVHHGDVQHCSSCYALSLSKKKGDSMDTSTKTFYNPPDYADFTQIYLLLETSRPRFISRS